MGTWVNVEKRKAYMRDYCRRNREEISAKNREYRRNNQDRLRQINRQRNQRRYANDLIYRLQVNLRNRLNVAIRDGQKAGSAVRDLGCSIEEFKSHISGLFEPGMSWDNWGEWHLDHIKPLASFDLTQRDQFLAACRYANLQPLWASENLRKGSREAS